MTDEYREQAEATIADLRARVAHYEALVVAVRRETAEQIAEEIEALRPDAAMSSPLSYRAGRFDAAEIARRLAE